MSAIPKNAWGFLGFGLRPNRWFFVCALVCVTLAALGHQASPYLFKLIIDAVEAQNMNLVPLYVALYPATFFIIQLLYRVAALLVARVCIGGKEHLYNALSVYILNHSHGYFADRMAGSLMTKISTAANAFENYIEYVIWNYLDSAISFGSTLLFIAFVSPLAALILGVVFIILFLLNYFLSGQAQAYSKISANAQSMQSGAIVDIVSNSSIVRQFGQQASEQQAVAMVSATAKRAEYTTRFYGEKMLLVNGLVITLGFAGMMWRLVYEYSAGSVSTGSMVFVLSLLMGMAYQLLYLGSAFQSGSQQFGQLKDAIGELLAPHDIVDGSDAQLLVVTAGGVLFSDVTFAYNQSAVFNNFSCVIPAGQRLGLVGPSGAGKSTFVSLLLRQQDIAAGTICIDGQNIAKVTQESLRTAISVVPQEPTLFHRTIRENIAYGKPDATDEEVIEVAKKAQAHDFISGLPEGYNTLVGERGVKLSGGQKQRVAIARAMLKDAPILILDEATSALDSESEVEIQHALHALMTGKTVIAIAHRLSTLREMDRIVVLENGAITEDGTHDTLKDYGGTYARLWGHQAGGFLE